MAWAFTGGTLIPKALRPRLKGRLKGRGTKPGIAHSWLWPALVLAVASAILQSHAIPYWTDQAGPWGWLWSPGAELLAWWFLSQRTPTGWGVGGLATVVVVGGPLAQMALPVVTEARVEARQVASLEERVQRLSEDIQAARERARSHRRQAAELQHYSDGRHKTQVELAQKADATAQKLRDKRRELQARLAEEGQAAGLLPTEQIHLGLHAGILLVAWAGSVSAVASLARQEPFGVTGGNNAGEGRTERWPETQAATDWRILVANRLDAYMRAHSLSQQDVAQGAAVKRPQVSLALAHERRTQEGRRTASNRTFEKLATFLDLKMHESNSLGTGQ